MQTHNSLTKRLLGALLLCLIPLTSQAEQPTWYEVELIVFSRTNPHWDAEAWPQFYERPALGPAIRLGENSASLLGRNYDPKAFTPLARNEYRLGEVSNRLAASSNYQVLMHTAWRQPGLERDKAIAVQLQTQAVAGAAEAAQPSEQGSMTGSGEPYGALAVERLNGTVRLVLSRYLHLETELYYTPEESAGYFSNVGLNSPEAAPQEGGEPTYGALPRYFLLQDSRRMRSRELHYIDHPLLGVIALVTPQEESAENGN